MMLRKLHAPSAMAITAFSWLRIASLIVLSLAGAHFSVDIPAALRGEP
jgi:hypothetical protein